MTLKKDYIIKFHGEAKISATSGDEAKRELEKSQNITTIRPVRTESLLYWIGKSILINIGGVIASIVMMIMIFSYSRLIIQIQTLPQQHQLIYFMTLIIFIVATMRFPNIVRGWFRGVGGWKN